MRSDTLIYQDQSAAALQLNVLEGVLDLGTFTCMASSSIGQSKLQIRAYIIGASHIVQLYLAERWCFSEILACTPVGAHSPPLFSQPVTELPDLVELELAENVFYRFSALLTDSQSGQQQLQTLEERIVHRGTESQRDEIGLWYDFPSLSNPHGSHASPKTLVWVALDEGSRAVTIATAHSYPHEDSIVFSQTQVFSLAPSVLV